MELCSDNHEEICHDSKICPACDLAQKVADLEDEVQDFKEQVERLQVGD